MSNGDAYVASKFANAAYHWLKNNGQNEVSTDELWRGIQSAYPELTRVSDQRKTPRTTLMRDLRKDKEQRFILGKRRVALRSSADS